MDNGYLQEYFTIGVLVGQRLRKLRKDYDATGGEPTQPTTSAVVGVAVVGKAIVGREESTNGSE